MVNRLKNRRDDSRSGGFRYKERDPKKMRERAEQKGGTFESIFKNGVDTWRPGDGDNTLRILPPTFDDAEHYGLDVWVHAYVGADQSTYLCPKKMKGDRCPICEAAADAKAAGEDDDFNQLKVKKQIIVWMLDREGDDPLLPKVWAMSWTMDRDIAALCNNKKTGKILSLDHPDEGFDVMFKRTGKGKQTRYIGIQIDRDPSPISPKMKDQKEILAEIDERPLDTLLSFKSEEYLEKAVMGTASKKSEDEEEDDDDRRGKRRSRDRDDDDADTRRSSRRGRDRDDEEGDERPASRSGRSRDEDDDGEDDRGSSRRGRRSRDEDDDDKPARRGRGSREEEEDPADEDDDDAEKASSRRGRRGRGDDDDDPPARSRRSSRDEDDDDKPRRRGGRDADDDEDDEKPKSRRGRDADEEEDDDGGSRRRRR